MNVTELLQTLDCQPDATLNILLPNGDRVPAHFHVTEVGHVQKNFIDCGGTRRSSASCLLQAWVAQDLDHRLTSGKLAHIIRLAAPLLGDDELPVEVEYEGALISQFPIAAAEPKADGIELLLTTKHTDCLAKDACGLVGANEANEDSGCCATSGCCG